MENRQWLRVIFLVAVVSLALAAAGYQLFPRESVETEGPKLMYFFSEA